MTPPDDECVDFPCRVGNRVLHTHRYPESDRGLPRIRLAYQRSQCRNKGLSKASLRRLRRYLARSNIRDELLGTSYPLMPDHHSSEQNGAWLRFHSARSMRGLEYTPCHPRWFRSSCVSYLAMKHRRVLIEHLRTFGRHSPLLFLAGTDVHDPRSQKTDHIRAH